MGSYNMLLEDACVDLYVIPLSTKHVLISYGLYCLAWVVVTDKLLKHIIPSFPCCHIIVLKVWTPTGLDAKHAWYVNFAKMWNFSFMQDP